MVIGKTNAVSNVMVSSVDKLRDVSSQLLAREPLDATTAHWLGAALDLYLKRDCRSIEEALGLRFPRGGVPWWLEDAMRKRDGALRELAVRFYSNERVTAQAGRIRSLAVRYAASAWRHDRDHDRVPGSYLETPRHYLWLAFKSGAPMPIGERQLRNILRS